MFASRRSSFRIRLLLLALTVGSATATASTPTLMWSGAKRVQLLCNVAGGPGIDHLALTADLCRSVQRLALPGATLPVSTIALGDPAALAPDAVTLLVHASVTATDHGRILAFTIRPRRTSATAEVLFGAPPRAVLLPSPALGGPALDAAIAAALAETLPWQVRPTAPRLEQSN